MGQRLHVAGDAGRQQPELGGEIFRQVGQVVVVEGVQHEPQRYADPADPRIKSPM